MALMARLQFGDNMAGLYSKEYLVMDCHLHFSRHHNHFKPDTDARAEEVELVVVAPGKEDLNFYEWYINNGVQSGRIIFDIQTVMSNNPVEKVILFENACCYSLEEEYHIDTQRRRCLRLSLVAEELTINDTVFKNLYTKGK